MIRRSPAEFYLKYLIVHPVGYRNEQIHEMCKKDQVDSLDDIYIERLRSTCVPPSPFYPQNKLHAKSQRFLLKEKIQLLFHSNEYSLEALKLLKVPRAKEFVEAMILSGAPAELIANALGTHRRFPCAAKTVELYCHFFWNIDLLDTTELRALLQLRAPAEKDVPKEQKASAGIYQKAFRDDPRVVAANLPNSPIMALMSQMKMGVMPRNVNLSDIIITTRAVAAMRSLEAVMIGGPFDSRKALEYSLVAKNMGEMLETVVRPDEKLREELSSIALQTSRDQIPTIDSLSGGQHTVEMSPKALTSEPKHTRGRKGGSINLDDGEGDGGS